MAAGDHVNAGGTFGIARQLNPRDKVNLRKRSFFSHLVFQKKLWFPRQARTNIGKALKKEAVFLQELKQLEADADRMAEQHSSSSSRGKGRGKGSGVVWVVVV
eukprot:COSAG06_NODE_8733_length_2083_cov_25.145665_2_plen_103_part_00